MIQQDQIEALAYIMTKKYDELNVQSLKSIGANIKRIGSIPQRDAKRLVQMAKYGADIKSMETSIALITKKTIGEVDAMFSAIAKTDYEASKYLYEAKGAEFVPFAANSALTQRVTALAKVTKETLKDLTKTSTLGMTVLNDGKLTFVTYAEAYKDIMDDALFKRLQGTFTYNQAMTSTLNQLGNSGLKKMYYNNAGKQPYARRLDSSIRQNLQYGMKQVAMETQDIIGKQVGADGWEVSYHSAPRDSHAGIGGEQYSADGNGVRVNGEWYPPFSDVEDLLDDYNCLHTKFSIVLGVSEPAYTKNQLNGLKQKDKEIVKYKDKSYSKYEATQVQRKLETKIRQKEDTYILAKAAGNTSLMDDCSRSISNYSNEYKSFSTVASLPIKKERMLVKGYSIKL